MQRNWIGKGKGLSIDFPVQEIDQVATAWTKFWETVYGVTYLVIAPETAEKWIVRGWDASPEVRDYIVKSLKKSEQQRLEDAGDKSGVDTQLTVKNPANGEIVPLWVADYVLANVGTGMVMGVPAHDKRDFDFAKKYKLPIKQVVKYSDETIDRNVSEGRESHEGEGELINSGKFDGMSAWGVGKEKMAEWMIKEGFAKWETTYHLRDWVFSRQRYWGEPIPLVYCDKCGDENGVVPVPEDQLPLELPTLDSYEPTETGESPLSRVESWVNTTCPNCGEPAKRETDTMPNWAGSCWYFLAYPFWDAKLKGEIINNLIDAKKYIKDWSPVDWYLGGAEHAVLHLLYARFWVKVLQDIGILDFPEPFLRLRSVGLVLAEDGKKMSKSIGNVVNPDDMVEKYGSDAVRMYEMFMGPWDQSIAWDSGAISGQVRFLGRIKDTINMKGKVGEQTSPQLAAKLKELVDRVERGVLEQKFNTSIAGLMEFVNAWRDEGVVLSKDHLIMFASLLSIFAPLTADEISQVKDREWPDVSSISGVDRVQVTIAVQVNGKLRSTVSVESSIAENQEKVIELVMSNEVVQRWVEGEPKKIIFVPGKLVNLVV